MSDLTVMKLLLIALIGYSAFLTRALNITKNRMTQLNIEAIRTRISQLERSQDRLWPMLYKQAKILSKLKRKQKKGN